MDINIIALGTIKECYDIINIINNNDFNESFKSSVNYKLNNFILNELELKDYVEKDNFIMIVNLKTIIEALNIMLISDDIKVCNKLEGLILKELGYLIEFKKEKNIRMSHIEFNHEDCLNTDGTIPIINKGEKVLPRDEEVLCKNNITLFDIEKIISYIYKSFIYEVMNINWNIEDENEGSYLIFNIKTDDEEIEVTTPTTYYGDFEKRVLKPIIDIIRIKLK